MGNTLDAVSISPDEFDLVWSKAADGEKLPADNCVTSARGATYCLASDPAWGDRFFADQTGQRLTSSFSLKGMLSFFATDTDGNGNDVIYVKGFESDEAKTAIVFDEPAGPVRIKDLPDMDWIVIPYNWNGSRECYRKDLSSFFKGTLYVSVQSGQIYVSAKRDLEHLAYIVNDQSWLVKWPDDERHRFLNCVDREPLNPPAFPQDIISCALMAAGDARTRQNLKRVAAAWSSSKLDKIDVQEGQYHFTERPYHYSSLGVDAYVGPGNHVEGQPVTEIHVVIDSFWRSAQHYYINRAGLIYRRVGQVCSNMDCTDYFYYFDIPPLAEGERSQAVDVLKKMEKARPDGAAAIGTVRTIFANYVVPNWAR